MKPNRPNPSTPSKSISGPEITCAVFIALLCTAYPLALPLGGGYDVIAAGKHGLFLALYIAFLLVMGEQKLVSGQKLSAYRKKPDVFSCFLLAYLFFTAVSALFSPYPGTFLGNARYEGVLTIGLYVFSTILLARNLRVKKWMLQASGAAAALLCLMGLIQLAGWNPFGLYPQGMDFYDAGKLYMGQFWSTVGNVNLCAAILSAAAGAFAAASIRGRGKMDWLFLVPLCLAVFSIVELDSEAGMVALIGGLVLLPPFLGLDGKSLPRLPIAYGAVLLALAASAAIRFYDGGVSLSFGTRALALGLGGAALAASGLLLGRADRLRNVPAPLLRRIFTTLSAAAIAAGFAALYFYNGFPEGFLSQAHQLLHGRWDDSFGSHRLFIWRQVWDLVREAPLLGGGPDTLGLRGLEGFSRYNEATASVVTSGIDAAHNEFLNIWVNQGLFALAAYCGALAVSAVRWWKDPGSCAKSVAGAAAMFYLIQSFFGISMCLSAPYLWIALAVINIKYERNV